MNQTILHIATNLDETKNGFFRSADHSYSDSTNDVIDSTALDHETNERNTTRKETQQDECTKFVARDGRECSDLWQKRAERAPPFAMPTATMWRTLFAALASRFTFRPDLSTFVRHDWKRRSTRKTR
jgi:hypothetical protein